MLNHLQKLTMLTAIFALALLAACGSGSTPAANLTLTQIADQRGDAARNAQYTADGSQRDINQQNGVNNRDGLSNALLAALTELERITNLDPSDPERRQEETATMTATAAAEQARTAAAAEVERTARFAASHPDRIAATENQRAADAAVAELARLIALAAATRQAAETASGTAQRAAATAAAPPRQAVNYASWTRGLAGDNEQDWDLVRDDRLTVNLETCMAIYQNRFLRTAQGSTSLSDCVSRHGNRDIPISDMEYYNKVVTFEDAGVDGAGAVGGFTFRNVLLDDDANCCSWFWRLSGASRNFYAGLHDNTDVGTVLTRSSGTASWKGRFYARTVGLLRGYTGAQTRNPDTEVDFTMQINFAEQTIAADIPLNGDTGGYDITGDYDDAGYLNGNIDNYGNDRVGTGEVRGVIGKRGLVAAFYSRNDTAPLNGQSSFDSGARYNGYSGGFVACPTANEDGTGACQAHR